MASPELLAHGSGALLRGADAQLGEQRAETRWPHRPLLSTSWCVVGFVGLWRSPAVCF